MSRESSARTRRQHVVSRFYLAGFADAKNQLQSIALPGDRSHRVSLNDASVIKDFYTVGLPNGEQSDIFERWFSELEYPAAEVLRSITTGGTWPLQERQKQQLAVWVALQHLRSESIRISQSQTEAEMMRLLIGASGKDRLRRHIESAEGSPISAERLDVEWADLTKPGGPTLEADPFEHVRTISELVGPTAQMLADMQWSLNVFQRKALFTSDHPVTLLPRPDDEPWTGVGLATAGGFALALSRRLGLVIGASPDLPDMRVPGVTKIARALQSGVVQTARRTLYAHPDDAAQLATLPLPEPREREIGPTNTESFVREEGLYAGLSAEQRQAPSAIGNGPNHGSVSLDDLPWPIPRRRLPPVLGVAS